MSIENLNLQHYSETEKTTVASCLASIESSLSEKFKNLKPEERTKYGSVNEQNKLVINKVKDFRASQPVLSSPDIDWIEFQNDVDSREFLQNTIMRLESLADSLKNNKILHDYECYQAALTDYDYSKYKLGTKATGYQVKVNELAQFFKRSNTKKIEEPTIKEIE
ncbi:hypothetical protein EV144_106177 [Flavobacterium sp. 270]|uniref:hypothetical protein n=1 Tax=Flavobacterium sp. 270 TaxID=2512114 RepID=UPI0010652896|nr:hypothetical protein [Flavobacterium sp. 270]TDW46505.1 hypothetical protein EV144_106177 [Flavobacterium sp. 270]